MIDQTTMDLQAVISESCGSSDWPVDEASMSVEIDGVLYTFPTAEEADKAKAALQILAEAAVRMKEISQSLKVLHRRRQIHIVE